MKRFPAFLTGALLPFVLLSLSCAFAASAATPASGTGTAHEKPLIDLVSVGVEKQISPQSGSEAQVSMARSKDPAAPGVVITIAPGKAGYPGVNIKPVGAEKWDLSAYGHVEARIVNTGSKPLAINVRVDNAGDWSKNPWSCEPISIKPGETGTANVIFGYSFGHKPSYPLKSDAIVNILFYTTKEAEERSFRIESILAAGPAGEKPPLNPNAIRISPKDGALLGPITANEVAEEVAKNPIPWDTSRPGMQLPDLGLRFETKGGAEGSMEGSKVRVVFPKGKDEQSVAFKPAAGYWDLREVTEVRLKVKNDGKTSITPIVQLLSGGGPTSPVAAAQPIAPGASLELVVPFAATVPSKGYPITKPGYFSPEKGTGTTFTSDASGPIRIYTTGHEGEASLLVESITCGTPVANTPDWLGKRPPVEGDWVKTFDDEFDGNAIDETKWNVYGPNYWDKKTHWSKANMIVKDGVAIQRFEKRAGYHNDDPAQKQTDYVCGFLDTYGKWTQRYGYFEARLKLVKAPGLWPTFWLMPDRGVEAGPQWKRQDTGNGAMELDIMEQLTRWGSHRHNIAMHWDGYGKDHKSIGSTMNYAVPDKDGFVTSGLLWTPGSAIFYCNGKEVFRWEDARIGSIPCEIIFETTTGGWDNNSVDDRQLPADYVIDYVRVWQRKDLASPVDGYKLPADARTQNGWYPPSASPGPVQTGAK